MAPVRHAEDAMEAEAMEPEEIADDLASQLVEEDGGNAEEAVFLLMLAAVRIGLATGMARQEAGEAARTVLADVLDSVDDEGVLLASDEAGGGRGEEGPPRLDVGERP